MTTLTENQIESLKKSIFESMLSDPNVGLGDVSNLAEAAEGIVNDWMLEHNIKCLDEKRQVKFVIGPKNKEVTALFPNEIYNTGGSHTYYTCYSHVGQHSGYSKGWSYTQIDATKEEYSDLLAELIRIGYTNLEIV